MRPTTVLFDLDATLISRRDMMPPFAAAFARRFYPAPDGQADPRAVETFLRLDAGGILARPGLFFAVHRALGHTDAPPAAEMLDFWHTQMPLYTRVIDGAHELLRGLRAAGFRLGIITNGNRVLQNGKLDHSGVRPLVEHIIVSGAFGCDKPDARIFHAALRHFSAAPQEAVYIGDNLINDIQGAHGAGMPAVWANLFGRENTTHETPDYEIHTLAQLWELPPFAK